MNIIQFQETLVAMRMAHYRHRHVDILHEGFRPVSGSVADFCTVAHDGRHHFFYIERRLQEGTPFYPGNEIYFGHASTADWVEWEVHDPALLIRPGTWEGGHLWAPNVLRYQGRFLMAYTGVSTLISQDIGLAWSDDLFHWERDPRNPISPLKDRPWGFWRADGICGCRDPHLLEHAGRLWMTYTGDTREGATCIALTSTADLTKWEDHGPILVGPADGYEPRMQGGHLQGSLESSNLSFRQGQWRLLAQFKRRDCEVRNWIFASDRMDAFDLASGREFWPGAYTTEVVEDRGTRSLLACASTIRLGEVDWADELPTARFIDTRERLQFWQTHL